ncbi:MAG: rod shape-determining protein MreD [Chloroflexi bacterium]|nr:rod shape-determining protein MreD [Chloroflexota bacterium]MCH8009065.1 rod shape-determining protein MreD [Chloroflexota bacterium]
MNYAIGVFAVLVAVISQVAIMPAFSVFGVQPNLVIVLLVAWMAARGRQEALVLIPIAGFTQGLLDSQPLGLAMLALAPLTLMTDFRELRLVDSEILPAIALTMAATVVYESTIMVTLVLTGESVTWLASVTNVLVPAAMANALLLIPVYWLIRISSLDLRQRPAFG